MNNFTLLKKKKHFIWGNCLSGIKLRKVEKNEQKEVERVNALNDVASILARRVAVEFSDSDSASESECDSEGWGEQESNLAWPNSLSSAVTAS